MPPEPGWLEVSPAPALSGWKAASAKRDSAAQGWTLAALALLGVVCGAIVAATELNSLYLCGTLIGCAFIFYDFRIGVVLLILLMPISASAVFPHAMLGITGLNPLNLLLAGTLVAYLVHALSTGSLRRFVPQPLLWLYVAPIVAAGLLGTRHIGNEILQAFYAYKLIDYHDVTGYLIELVGKPMLMVAFALLVGAAVARSAKPEKFLVPLLLSVWVMGLVVVVFVVRSGIGLGQLANSEARDSLSALGLHANELGRLYVVAYALLLFTWAKAKGSFRLRIALAASIVLVLVALMLTFSRSAFAGAVVVSGLFVLWHPTPRTLIVSLLMVAGALIALPEAVYDRIGTGFGEGLNAISAGRIQGLWLPLLPDVLRSPIYGSGLNSILWSDAMVHNADGAVLAVTHPHNAYLEAALDMGLVGLVLLCSYFVHVWRGFRRLSADPALSAPLRGFYLGAAAGLLALLIADIADSSLAPRPEQAFLWLAIGMMYGQRAR